MKKTGTNFLTRVLCLTIIMVMVVSLLPFEVMALPTGASAKVHPISVVNFITNGVKAIDSFNRASKDEFETAYGTNTNFCKSWLAYFTGNTDFDKLQEDVDNIADLSGYMKVYSKNMLETVTEISLDVSALKDDVKRLSEQLKENQEYEVLKIALDSFYTDFFSTSYGELLEAYQAVETALYNSNDATIKVKMDDLYMKAYKMESIEAYITGKNRIDGESILDMYLKFLKQNDTSEDVIDTTLDFTLKMFEAAIFQKYCLSYACSYQLNYVNDNITELIANGNFIGYTVYGTLDGFVNRYTISEIKSRISSAKSGIDNVSVAVIKNLVNIYELNQSVGYTEGGYQYYTDVKNGETNAYKNSSYQLMSISDELAEMFDLKLYYSARDNGVASWTTSGCVTVDGSTGQNFEISYMYGDGTAENSKVIYTVKFNICDRVFSGGYGSDRAPYLIGNKEELQRFASDSSYWKSGVCVKLIRNIDMSGDSLGTIANYYGSFDGGGHTISNLSRNYGWFTDNYGEIKNLNFSKLNISKTGGGGGISGGIVDENYGEIINCNIVSASVYGYWHNIASDSSVYTSLLGDVGGITGINSGTIKYCSVLSSNITSNVSSVEAFDKFGDGAYADGSTITLKSYAGGIAAVSNGGEISDCYVSNTNVTSYVKAGYLKYKVKFGLIKVSEIYVKVSAYSNYGKIVGSLSDTQFVNNTYNGGSSNGSITKYAFTSSKESRDDSFVTTHYSLGNDGSYTSNTSMSPYISALTISKLPQKTEYTVGEYFNCAGLEVVNDHNEAVYGFTVSIPSTSTEGEQTVTVSMGDLSVDFSVSVVSCYHKTIRYDAEQQSTCKSNGYTAGVYCLDCNTYTDGHEVIIKNDSAHHWENDICTECGASKQSGSIPKTDARIKVSSVTCSSNASQVRVPIVMENNPGVVSVQLTVTYDEQAIELIGLEDGGILGTALHSDKYANGYKMSWANDTTRENFTDNGTIATLVFKLKPNVSDGEYQVSLSYNYSNFDIMDVNMNCVAFEVQDGYISVTSSLIGDVNGDGKVLPNDRVILARTLAGWSDYPMDAIDQIAADVDGNGKVNQRDRMILSRYLAGWSDYSKLPYTQN